MPNFITKILSVEFLTNFKVAELEHEFEPGDLAYDPMRPMDSRHYIFSIPLLILYSSKPLLFC